MPTYRIETPEHRYPAIVERGVVRSAAQYLPAKAGKVFVVSTEDVWRHCGRALAQALLDAHKAKFPNAHAGAAVAVAVRTGAIIAMASLPT